MLWVFSDVKNFFQDQKVERRNYRWLRQTTEEVTTVLYTKFQPP